MATAPKNKQSSVKPSNKDVARAEFKTQADKKVKTAPALLQLFVDSIKDIYWAEKHLTKSLPKMQKAATSAALATAIGEHIAVTENHVMRLESIFELLGEKAQAKKCEAMEGLSKEGEGIIEDTDEGTATRDVGIILASQKVEHYEIATYSGLAQLATTLGLSAVADLLSQTLAEEQEADQTLASIAQNDINYQADDEAV